ncbi:hypothetical protein KBC03_03745 [Patescibacteria group bacterium]|nr:hypothetical protein [Patescibacteria group bacterium]
MIIEQYKQKFAELLVAKTGMSVEDIIPMIEQPPQAEMGDLAFPCFSLAKALKKAPPMIAADVASGLSAEGFSEIKALGPYVNAFIDKTHFVAAVLAGEKPAVVQHKEKVLLEYMS